MTLKFWKRLLVIVLIVPVVLFFAVVLIAYWKQDKVVQELVSTLNKDFVGEITVDGSHISPFENFPYISIDLDHVKIFETKENHEEPVVDLKDVYVGFDIWTLLSGEYDIKVLELSEGYVHVIQHKDGEMNIVKALSSSKPVEEIQKDFHIHLKSILLSNVDIYKLSEANNLIVESFVDKAELSFKTDSSHIVTGVNAQLEMNIIKDGDTTFFKHKHLNITSEVEYLKLEQQIIVNPSILELEHATFNGEGFVDILDDFFIDFSLYGTKDNFELFMALAPEELYPTLKTFENSGEIDFDVKIAGNSSVGNTPIVDAVFSCKNAHFENSITHKKVDELNFSGSFTNNGLKGLENMEFSLTDFTAKPEAGTFATNLYVKNFESPEIDMSLDSDFDLGFLTSFINATSFEDLQGKIKMHMKFHDIIDLTRPERSIERLNEAYYSEILVEDLRFKTSSYHLPLENLNTRITIEGHQAEIEYFKAQVGNSDLSINGHISDLPAILHHTNDKVTSDLTIVSKLLDLQELTKTEKKEGIDEKIDDLSLKLKFISSAKSFTESPNLPVGEFFVEDLYATLEHYPHTFHDFHGDLFVEDSNFRIIDFSGMIDQSDFHFSGKLLDYERWLEVEPKGDTKIEFDLTSKQLQLEDLFSYKGENYVPEDYRHEVFSDLKLHGNVDLHFNQGLRSSDVTLTQVDAKMKVHPMKFENFKGRVHIEDEHLVVEELKGEIGKSKFNLDMNYYFGKDESIRKRDNHFGIKASRLDLDELFNYNKPANSLAQKPSEHEDVFNIYELPFSDMTFDIDIDHLNYHRYLLDDLHSRFRTTPNHYIYVDTMRMKAAGGKVELSGYFNGSNKDKIYCSPNLKLNKVDLDKLLFKFENFGQDHLVSENLHGTITTRINGKVHLHADMVPILDDSEVHMDVAVIDGSLMNYAPIVDLKEYFVDKNVYKVKFDTLKNHIDFNNGVINIPNMTINSTLGFMKVSGKQDMDFNMEYYISVPLKLVAGTGFKKLFGRKKEEVKPEQEDQIEYLDRGKKQAFVNLKIIGDAEDFKVSLGKKKKKK